MKANHYLLVLSLVLIAADKPKPKEPCQDLIYCEASDDRELRETVSNLLDDKKSAARIQAAISLRKMGHRADPAKYALCKAFAVEQIPDVKKEIQEAIETADSELASHMLYLGSARHQGVIDYVEAKSIENPEIFRPLISNLWHSHQQTLLVGTAGSELRVMVLLCHNDEVLIAHVKTLAGIDNRKSQQSRYVAVAVLPLLAVEDRKPLVQIARTALRQARTPRDTVVCMEALAELGPVATAAIPDLQRYKTNRNPAIKQAAMLSIDKIERSSPAKK